MMVPATKGILNKERAVRLAKQTSSHRIYSSFTLAKIGHPQRPSTVKWIDTRWELFVVQKTFNIRRTCGLRTLTGRDTETRVGLAGVNNAPSFVFQLQ